jgi:hypothetical protein
VEISQHLGRIPRRRRSGIGVAVCLVLLFVGSCDAIHIHEWTGSSQSVPAAPHFCLLCLSAHLPLTLHASPMVLAVRFSHSTVLVPDTLDSYDSVDVFSLYTRPPPQA